MSRGITFEIDGQKEDVGTIWVHLRNPDTHGYASYRIRVPASYMNQVFDPNQTKDIATSWATFINDNIMELGTFILEGYIENIASVLEEKRKPYRWVIVSVENILESEDEIEITGQVVPIVNQEINLVRMKS
jgi:hypothetical protein